MFKGTRTNPSVSCGKVKPGIALLAERTTRGIGRRAVIAMLGGMMDGQVPNANTQWCPKCEKYYNSKAPHECIVQDINDNRERLERWLGRFKVKEDS